MVKMDVFTSEEAIPQLDLAADDPNPINLHLRRSVHAPRQQLEIHTADPIVLSGLHFQGINSIHIRIFKKKLYRVFE